MKRSLTFHVPPDARPASMRALLEVLSRDGADQPLTRSEVLDQMASYMDGTPRGEVLTLARDLGISTQTGQGITPSPRAAALAKSDAQTDLVHGLQYLAWSSHHPDLASPLWTYRTVVDLFWEKAGILINSDVKRLLVEEILVRAEEVFRDVPGFDPAHTSIGPKSIDGITVWLKELNPPVIHDGSVKRRQTCAPQLLLMALGATARKADIAPDTDFRLAPEQRDWICRCCFLEPESFDRMLDWTIMTQPQFIRWGTLITTYGRQVVLRCTDLAPEDMR